MTLISDLTASGRRATTRWGAHPPVRTSGPTLMPTGGSVIALRRRRAVALGGLIGHATAAGANLVSATDLRGHNWWIPASTVWCDADDTLQPQLPRPIGLSMGASTQRAVLAGISDRLGWEAVGELERRRELPIVDPDLQVGSQQVTAYDGRLDHGVPTVVLVGEDTVRWGAGATWDAAVRRATYGDEPSLTETAELDLLAALLADQGLDIACVDLGTALLRGAGIVRCSVQLLSAD